MDWLTLLMVSVTVEAWFPICRLHVVLPLVQPEVTVASPAVTAHPPMEPPVTAVRLMGFLLLKPPTSQVPVATPAVSVQLNPLPVTEPLPVPANLTENICASLNTVCA